MENKKRSKLVKWAAAVLARAWHIRYELAVAIAYTVLFCWLFSTATMQERPKAFAAPKQPEWSAPGDGAWFGKNGTGADLFQLARTGMANSVLFALASVLGGVVTALLISAFVAMGKNPNRFRSLQRFSFNVLLLPAFVGVLIVAAGSHGNMLTVMGAVTLVIALALLGVIGDWCETAESGGDVMAGMTLGMTRLALVKKRTLPIVAKKCITLFAGLLPAVVAAEMALSFLGLLGDRISCGRIIAVGRENLIEAPWISVYPGILATIILVILAGLAWCVARLTKVGMFARIF